MLGVAAWRSAGRYLHIAGGAGHKSVGNSSAGHCLPRSDGGCEQFRLRGGGFWGVWTGDTS